METYSIYWPQFYTATILEWKPFSLLLVGLFHVTVNFFDSLVFSHYVLKKSSAIPGPLLVLLTNNRSEKHKKLKLKLVSFINESISYILASVLHHHNS